MLRNGRRAARNDRTAVERDKQMHADANSLKQVATSDGQLANKQRIIAASRGEAIFSNLPRRWQLDEDKPCCYLAMWTDTDGRTDGRIAALIYAFYRLSLIHI